MRKNFQHNLNAYEIDLIHEHSFYQILTERDRFTEDLERTSIFM